MYISLESLTNFLRENGIDWTGEFYTKEPFYSFNDKGYQITKAASFYELVGSTYGDVVLLYTGDEADIKNDIVDETNKKFIPIVLTETSLKIVEKTEKIW